MVANNFTVTIQAKPYVKAYLENNCGVPVNLKNIPELQAEFIRCLSKKTMRRETAPVASWYDRVTIIIPPDAFYRYGWELNKTNIAYFNKFVEQKVKFLMRNYVAMHCVLGVKVAESIRDFQEQYNLPETVWPYESIKKDYDRHSRGMEFKPIIDFKQKLREIFMSNLSDLGTFGRKQKLTQNG